MVELGVYNGILRHLLIPVVTDPTKAAGALQWAVTEMMRRYRLMADAGVRDLASYNKEARVSGEFETMPQIVVVIDELADLMLVAAKEVEESICRVAQMGRAAGMHLVISPTQRPSADVITGLMKANIPSRIAVAVASAMESRIILDTAGGGEAGREGRHAMRRWARERPGVCRAASSPIHSMQTCPCCPFRFGGLLVDFGHDLVGIFRRIRALDEGHDLLHLVVGDEAALHALGLGRLPSGCSRACRRVPTQLLRARRVEDDARLSICGGDRKGDARGNIGLH